MKVNSEQNAIIANIIPILIICQALMWIVF